MSSHRQVVLPIASAEKYRFKPRWWQVGLSVLAIFMLPICFAALLF